MNPKTKKRIALNKETVRRLTPREISRNQMAGVAGGEPVKHTGYCTYWLSCSLLETLCASAGATCSATCGRSCENGCDPV